MSASSPSASSPSALFSVPSLKVRRGPDLVVRSLGGLEDRHEVHGPDGELIAAVIGIHKGPRAWRALKAFVGFMTPFLQSPRRFTVVDPAGSVVLHLRSTTRWADVKEPDGKRVGVLETSRAGHNLLRVQLYVGDKMASGVRLRKVDPDAVVEGTGPAPAFDWEIREEGTTRAVARLSDDGKRQISLELRPPVEEPLRRLLVGVALVAVDPRWQRVPRAPTAD